MFDQFHVANYTNLHFQVTIAKKYGGNYYFDSNDVNSNSLNEAFGKNPCGDDGDEKDKDVPLLSSAGVVKSKSSSYLPKIITQEATGRDDFIALKLVCILQHE